MKRSKILLWCIGLSFISSCANKPLIIANFAEQGEMSSWQVPSKETKWVLGKKKKLGKFSGTLRGKTKTLLLLKNGTWDFSGYDVLMLEVAGRGGKFRFVIQDKAAKANGTTYELAFAPHKKIISVHKLLLRDFKAYRKGQQLDGVDPLDFKSIASVGIRVASNKKSRFRLSLDSFWLEAN